MAYRKRIAINDKTHTESGFCVTVVDIKEFNVLFPKGPLKISSKVAGIPKPKSCI
ncbi:MAG: TusE/DsrC/DsvC family sulfur relay protein [Flavobacteriales bacterium]|nr:TusE/DsrC/DsvC family sulfur relay protein [Flavobacteriales bacterium]